MGVLDMYIINYEKLIKGFDQVLGKNSYLIVRDKNTDLICITYNIKECRQLIEMYLEKNNINISDVDIYTETIRKNDLRYEQLMKYKLVLLDFNLVLYKDVINKSKDYIIESYEQGKPPKFGINKYFTLTKKEYSKY